MLPEIKVGEKYGGREVFAITIHQGVRVVSYQFSGDYYSRREDAFRELANLDKPIPVERLLTLAELPPVPFGVRAINGWQRTVTEVKDDKIFTGAACWTISGLDATRYEFHDGKAWRSFKTTEPLGGEP